MNDLITRVKDIMIEKGITQGDIAVALGTQRQNINQMLTRNPSGIRLINLQRILDVLGYELQIIVKQDNTICWRYDMKLEKGWTVKVLYIGTLGTVVDTDGNGNVTLDFNFDNEVVRTTLPKRLIGSVVARS